MWNVILSTITENKVLNNAENQPKKSGNYLCTCVKRSLDGKYYRYLQTMAYDKERNTWHDIGHNYGISHNILAWTDKVPLCDAEFDYIAGGILVEKNKGV